MSNGLHGMSVSLRPGITYILVIETTEYAGNFERELCGHATGIWDFDRYHGEKNAGDARADNSEMVTRIVDKAKTVSHDDYGYVSNTIRQNSQNGSNTGYQSVAIFFEQPLDEAEMQFVRDRAGTFKSGRMKIIDIYMVEAAVSNVAERRLI